MFKWFCQKLKHDIFLYILYYLVVKNPPANARDVGSAPGREGNGRNLQDSCLENHMDRGAWQATVHRVTELDMTEATQHASMHTKQSTSILYISVFLNNVTPWNLKFTLSWTSWPHSSVVIWRPARKPKTSRPFPIAVHQQQLPCWFSLISIEDEENLVSSLFTQLVSMIFFFNWNFIISFCGCLPQIYLKPNNLFLCDYYYFTLKLYHSSPPQLPRSFEICVLVTVSICRNVRAKAEIIIHFVLAFLKLYSAKH